MFAGGTSIVGDEVVTIFAGTTFTNGGGITVFASVDGTGMIFGGGIDDNVMFSDVCSIAGF